jgi:anti-sigma regulatory factor (Ser/Thr protein kinase)
VRRHEPDRASKAHAPTHRTLLGSRRAPGCLACRAPVPPATPLRLSPPGERGGPGARRGGGGIVGGDRLITQASVRASLTVPGRPEQVAAARTFVADTLGPGNPHVEIAALLVSELVTNSLRHSDSALDGGTVTITVTGGMAGPDSARVEVTDCGGTTLPVVRTAGGDDEGGRGMQLVKALSSAWGCRRHGNVTTTWFELAAEPDPAGPRPAGERLIGGACPR